MDRIGRYQIVKELGRGAMGVVYHAVDPAIGRPVAIKVIRLGDVANADERARLRERLFREARSAGMLSHPGIVTIYDVGEQGDIAYIAMEFVNGPTLDTVLSAPDPIEPKRVITILGQTAMALDYAHQKGIVHRDIKPANIMLDEDGQVKITDFGIAKITTSEQFTMTGTIVGTPNYMSPEQVQGKPIDGRSDQFSLAVIAYEMLTGEKPFAGEQLTTVVYRIVAEEPAAPHRLNPSLGNLITAVLARGLAKKPEARFKICNEFIEALENACLKTKGWRPLSRGASLNMPTAVEATRPGVAKPDLPPPRPRPGDTTVTRERRRVGVFPIVAAVLVAAGLVGMIAWQATPWLSGTGQAPGPVASSAAPAEAPVTPPSTVPAAPAEEPKPSPLPPAESAPPAPAETEKAKPEPQPEAKRETEPETKPAPEEASPAAPVRPAPAPRAPVRRGPFPVSFTTTPEGAIAMLDNQPEMSCTTPCSLDAAPGRHSVTITRQGHQTEHREIDVSGSAVELPPILLQVTSGTLMLSSAPPGASIQINGKDYGKTPAQINLTPGRYTVTLEKDGQRKTEQVDVPNGIRTLRMVMGQ